MNVLEENIKAVIKALGDSDTLVNVTEVLKTGQKDFDAAFALAVEMDNRNLVKLLYSNFNQNKIVVEITLVGQAAYKNL